jgi:hypothetical protein
MYINMCVYILQNIKGYYELCFRNKIFGQVIRIITLTVYVYLIDKIMYDVFFIIFIILDYFLIFFGKQMK